MAPHIIKTFQPYAIDTLRFALNHKHIPFAIILGVTPAIVWLFFWTREDRFHKGPRWPLFFTFLAGAGVGALLLPLSPYLKELQLGLAEKLFIFASIEEFAKFLVVFLMDYKLPYFSEPIDYAIYLISGALGFAAFENVLYLAHPSVIENLPYMIETGMFRFLGSTILHSVLAAILGLTIGFVFYKKTGIKLLYASIGLVIVSILHTIYNYFIIEHMKLNGFLALGILWVVSLIVISLFEKVRVINH